MLRARCPRTVRSARRRCAAARVRTGRPCHPRATPGTPRALRVTSRRRPNGPARSAGTRAAGSSVSRTTTSRRCRALRPVLPPARHVRRRGTRRALVSWHPRSTTAAGRAARCPRSSSTPRADGAEADVAHAGVDHLWAPCSGAVSLTVAVGAEERPALDHLAGDAELRLRGS